MVSNEADFYVSGGGVNPSFTFTTGDAAISFYAGNDQDWPDEAYGLGQVRVALAR